MRMPWIFQLGMGILLFVFFYKTIYGGNLCQQSSHPIFTEVQSNSVIQVQPQLPESQINGEQPSQNFVKSFSCDNITPRTYYAQRGNFWVLYNYIKATKKFNCDESITYTSHGEFIYLDNLIPVLERWQGPVSISLYAPGSDFKKTLKTILYLRKCLSSHLVKEFVTFHIYFGIENMPKEKIPIDPISIPVDCSKEKVTFGHGVSTFRKDNNLTYPVNVGRMIARDMSTTYFVLPSDIELYPSPGIIPAFLEMVQRDNLTNQKLNGKVFVLPIFEADINIPKLPQNKTELIQMERIQLIVPFHKYVCPACHAIPKAEEWPKEPIKPGMRVFHVGKREGLFKSWEPFYIGTKFVPGYDERLSWEGMRDKMTQGFALCVLDYEFHVLDNAFLIHKPGIKMPFKANLSKLQLSRIEKQNYIIDKEITPELEILYGTKQGCIIDF